MPNILPLQHQLSRREGRGKIYGYAETARAQARPQMLMPAAALHIPACSAATTKAQQTTKLQQNRFWKLRAETVAENTTLDTSKQLLVSGVRPSVWLCRTAPSH